MFNNKGFITASFLILWVPGWSAPLSQPLPIFSYISAAAPSCHVPAPLFGVKIDDPAICTVPSELPLGSFVPPPVGQSYIDPTFGGHVTTLADPDNVHPYALPTAVSATNKYVVVRDKSGAANIIDNVTGAVVFRNSPFSGQGRFWDGTDDDVYYWISGVKVFKRTLSTGQNKVVLDFSTKGFTNVQTGGSSELAMDGWLAAWDAGNHLVCAGNVYSGAIYCADFHAPEADPRGIGWGFIDYALMTKGVDSYSGRRYVMLMASPAFGAWVLDVPHQKLTFAFRGPELPEKSGNGDGICDPGEPCLNSPHGDEMMDSDGRQYFVTGYGSENPCSIQVVTYHIGHEQLMAIPVEKGGGKRSVMTMARCSGDEWPDGHTGCARNAPYCVMSNYSDHNPTGLTKVRDEFTPHMREIIVMRGNGLEIRRIATNGAFVFPSDPYWGQPRACISQDGREVVFDSNFGVPNAHHVMKVETGFGGATPPPPPPQPVLSLNKSSLSFTATAGGSNPASQAVTVTNTGAAGSTLNWTGSSGGTAWLSLSPTSGAVAPGSAGSAATVSITIAGLSAGTYNGLLTFTDKNAPANTKPLPITLTLGARPPVPLLSGGSPTGTLAAGTISTTIGLNTDVAAVCKYDTSAATAYSGMTLLMTASNAGKTHAASVSGLTNGQAYHYYVRCANTQDAAQVNTTSFLISFAVNVPSNQAPTVGPLSAIPSDVDPLTVGVQEYAASSVQYSAVVSDPDHDPLTWQWYYTLNGGARIPWGSAGSGAGTAQVSFAYPAGSAGTQYTWILRATDNKSTFTEKTLNVMIIGQNVAPPALPVPLPQPIVAYPAVLPINQVLSIANFGSYAGVTFQWTFTPIFAISGSALEQAGAIGAGVPIPTQSATLQPSSVGLNLGVYEVSVVAMDGHGGQSAESRGQVTLVAENLSHLKVYPNPWRSDRHLPHPTVTFAGLTVGTTIKLFTISGQAVREFTSDGTNISWDLKNDNGEKVASGIYVYFVADMQGDKVRGKVAIIH